MKSLIEQKNQLNIIINLIEKSIKYNHLSNRKIN